MPIGRDIWGSVMAFLACETQWRVIDRMGHLFWYGLDYTAVKTLLDLEGKFTPELSSDIRFTEAAALPVLNKGD